jgi:hypothetical protein
MQSLIIGSTDKYKINGVAKNFLKLSISTPFDHLLIYLSQTSFQSLNVPTNLPIPILDLSRHISWSVYADAMLASLATAARKEADVRYETFIRMICSLAEAAQTRGRPGETSNYALLQAV